MKRTTVRAIIAFLALSFLGQSALAGVIDPDVSFTLRAPNEAGPATGMDANWNDGGFQGFVTNSSFSDHTLFEFDMAAITAPVLSASLEWSFERGSIGDTVFVDSYVADGVASLSDWVLQNSNLAGTGTGSPGAQSIDVTSLVQASAGAGFLGFSFSIDTHPQQAFFEFSNPNGARLNVTFAAVPAPATILMVVLGLLATGVRKVRGASQST